MPFVTTILEIDDDGDQDDLVHKRGFFDEYGRDSHRQ
jgi:hypothetical protein